MITENDHRKRYCPRLGHELSFAYCREPGEKSPCTKIYDCWWQTFDIQLFIKQHYPEDVAENITNQQKTKVLSLFEMIQQAQRINKK